MGSIVKQLFADSPLSPWSTSGAVGSLRASPPAQQSAEQPQQQHSGHKRQSASFRAPCSDDEDEADALQQQQRRSGARSQQQHHSQHHQHSSLSPSWTSQQVFPGSQQHPVEAVLAAHTRELQAAALHAAGAQQAQLHGQIQAVEADLVAQLAAVQQQLAAKRSRAAAADEAARAARSAERSRRLQEVQRQQAALEQAQASAVQEVRRAQEEAARQAAAEAEARLRQQQEEEQRRKAEAEAAAAAAAAQAKAAQDAAQAQQPAAAASLQAAAQPAASLGPAAARSPGGSSHVKASPAALAYQQQLAAKLAEAEAAAAQLVAQPELKAQRRALEKQITMAVSQISGTQQQVQAKAKQLIAVLSSCSTPQQTALACTCLASRVVSQCEGQIQKIGSFAFPLAYVCVAVGAAVPTFMELLIAKLHRECPLLVPAYTMYAPSSPRAAWYAALGYKQVEDQRSGEMRFETADEFVSRLSAMVLLYAAIVQTDAAGNPAGLGHGWTWLARLLNSLPANRPSAAALMAFLSHAGYRMAAVYGAQFTKLLGHLTTHFLPQLEAKAAKDPDLRAVGTRLQTYVSARQFAREPEGRSLKKVDESSYTRA